jgi:CRP-like cAMP-binding protein
VTQIRTGGPLLDIARVLSVLNKISLFGGLDDTQLYTLFRHLGSAHYRAGEAVFRQGDPPTHIYIVLSGRVKIITEVDHTPMELVVYGEGQCFGETAAIGILAHSATALAEADTELIVLPVPALRDVSHESPALFGMLMYNIAREACRRLHRTDEIFLHYATRKNGK